MNVDKKHTISEMAEIIGYPPHVLRYYEKEFEIEIPRNESNHRYYTYKEVELFQFVKELQEKGFNNKQIKTIIESPEELTDEQEELAMTTFTAVEKVDTSVLANEISSNLYEKIHDDLKPFLNIKYDGNEKLILELKDELVALKKEISSKERDVLILRFGLNNDGNKKTLDEIGSIYGVSRERIRQIENRAISKLKKLCKNKNLTSGLKNYFGE